jgi:hypothetical protein
MAKLGKSKPKASREREGELVGRAEADVHPHTTQHSSTHTQSYVHNNNVVYSHSYYPHAIRNFYLATIVMVHSHLMLSQC